MKLYKKGRLNIYMYFKTRNKLKSRYGDSGNNKIQDMCVHEEKAVGKFFKLKIGFHLASRTF